MNYGNIIHRLNDDSFVITKDGFPYHVPKNVKEFSEEWKSISEYAKDNPEKVFIEEIKEIPFEDLKNSKKSSIDSETRNKIYNGFNYVIDGLEYHFSYGATDQQNYADDTNLILYQKYSGIEPISIISRTGYSIPDNHPVFFQFKGDAFLDLYYNGALAHKNKVLKEGKDRKNKVERATTKEELDII
jgi:hypothetical protein